MPPAALQVQTQQSQESQSSFRKSNIIQNKVYHCTKNKYINRNYSNRTGESKIKNRDPNFEMDSINERKMQRPSYQGHGHVHGHGHPTSHPHAHTAHQHTLSQSHLNISNHSHSHASSHPHSSYNRSSQHSSSSTRRPRVSSSQNMSRDPQRDREGRSRHSKELSSSRRSSSNSAMNVKNNNSSAASTPYYPSHAVHPTPPQSNAYPNKDDINHNNMANGNLTNVPNSNMYSQSGQHNHHNPNNTSSSIQGSGTTQGHSSMASGAASSGGQQVNMNPNPRRPAYLLHRDLVIGKGSYGQVCIASRGEAEGHISTSSSNNPTRSSGKRKKFACKCVGLRNDPKYIAKLQEEVNVLRELRGHDNVIRLYDVFCVDNELFIITELGRGGDLFHLLTTHPKHGVTESYAAKTVAQMLSAVAFLHSRNICHRDLKLENWVLESGRDVWSPLKLIDFGLSTHFTPGHRLSRVVGSSYYVAPEVLKKSYTEACDLWSLGVIVYMLLSGAPPFYGKNDEAIKASIVNGEYTFPHELFRDVSDDAMAFVSTLLSYNTEYRYTADQALTHIWLSTNCDPDQLRKAKNGARGNPQVLGSLNSHGHINSDSVNSNSNSYVDRPEPMQM